MTKRKNVAPIDATNLPLMKRYRTSERVRRLPLVLMSMGAYWYARHSQPIVGDLSEMRQFLLIPKRLSNHHLAYRLHARRSVHAAPDRSDAYGFCDHRDRAWKLHEI